MTTYIIDIENITAWYWVMTAFLMLMGIFLSIFTKQILPIAWNSTVSIVLVLFAQYLEPMLFGWYEYSDWTIRIISAVIFIVWISLIMLIQFNFGITEGKKAVA